MTSQFLRPLPLLYGVRGPLCPPLLPAVQLQIICPSAQKLENLPTPAAAAVGQFGASADVVRTQEQG
jgi:hypothetical protein